MERVLFQLHLRTCHFGLRLSGSTRRLLEHLLLVVAIAGFGALILLHRNFVSRAVCLETISNFNPAADLHHLTILPISTLVNQSYIPSKDTCDSTGILESLEPLEPQVSYSATKAYLLLPTNHTLLQHVPQIQHIVLSPHDPHCFGEPFLQFLIHNVIGYETITWNWFVKVVQMRNESIGYVITQGRVQELRVDPHSTFHRKWLSKLSVLIKTSFLFFFSTTLISFTLRETQERMLGFTQELTRRVSIQMPLLDLVVFHLIHNLVFVPIMVGMMFFLIEFYSGDRLLAFLVMTIVWCVEVFSVISLRSYQGITFFPRMFFLLFCLFHIYYFANPYGFAYTALVVNGLFMAHSMVFFWHRYELPAVALGRVTADRPRLQWDDGRSPSIEPVQQQSPIHQVPYYDRVPHSPPINRRIYEPLQQQQQQQEGHQQQQTQRLARHTSFSSQNSNSRNSGGLFREDEEEEDLLYILQGEVVVRRERSMDGITEVNTAMNTTTTQDINEEESQIHVRSPPPATIPTTPDRDIVYSGDDSKSGLQSILEVRLTPRHSNEIRPRTSPPNLPSLPS